MAKSNRISVNEFQRVAKEYAEKVEWAPTTTIEWNGLELTVKRRLSLKEMLGFVERVANSCFASDTGEYLPEVKEFAIRSNVLDTYANFTMPKSIDTQYELVYATDVYDIVMQYIDPYQLSALLNAIDEKINYKKTMNLDHIENTLNDALQQMQTSINAFSEVMDGVSADDVQNLINAVSNNSIDEEKIVNALMKYKEEHQPAKVAI